MSDPDRDLALTRHTSQWLDTDDDDGDSPSSRESTEGGEQSGNTIPGPLDGSAEEQIADLQIVDALLASQSNRARTELAAHIQRVVRTIRQPARAAPLVTHRRLRTWRTGFAVAATLLVSLGLFWLLASKESRASAVLREIGRVSLELHDRVYTIRHHDARMGGHPHREGSLYLRGCEGVVVACDDVVVGCNADGCWLVPSSGSVMVAEDFDWIMSSSIHEKRELELLKAISVESRRTLLVQLSAVATLLQQDYDVTLESTTEPGGDEAEVLVGRLRAPRTSDLPGTIRIWSRADTRIIQRAEFSWGSPESDVSQLVLELTDRGPVPADWYAHDSHHPSGRPVRHVSPDK